jgi:hypothetical protein
MYRKIVIFVAISAFLVAAIYCTSAFTANAAQTQCTFLKNGDSICVSGDKKKVSYCIHDPKTHYAVKCLELSAAAKEDNDLLRNALSSAIEESPNNTKVPKSEILKGNAILEQNNTNNDNVKEPKAPKVPEDLGGFNNNSG